MCRCITEIQSEMELFPKCYIPFNSLITLKYARPPFNSIRLSKHLISSLSFTRVAICFNLSPLIRSWNSIGIKSEGLLQFVCPSLNCFATSSTNRNRSQLQQGKYSQDRQLIYNPDIQCEHIIHNISVNGWWCLYKSLLWLSIYL